MTRITKDTLRKLNDAVGALDTDNGQIFAGFVGRLHMADGLYHGKLLHLVPCDDPPRETVSIQSILSPAEFVGEPDTEVNDGDA